MKYTALYDQHQKLQAKICDFAGYKMPLQYDASIIKEHTHVRLQAGLFDISHMGQIMIIGEGAVQFLEKITPSLIANMNNMQSKYTVMTNPRGGIVDDIIITKLDDNKYQIVVNGACKTNDLLWMRQYASDGVVIKSLDQSLLALQGPMAQEVLSSLLGQNFDEIYYMESTYVTLKNGNKILVSRLGYTGEDGFEISATNSDILQIWQEALQYKSVKPIGFAARDSLRMEMGYALYGKDIDQDTTPIEAGIGWIISKNNTNFIGSDIIIEQKAVGTDRIKRGLLLVDKGVARGGEEVIDNHGNKVGIVKSGCYSPCLKKSIAVAYMNKSCNNAVIIVRGKKINTEIVKLPFMPARTKIRRKKQERK